MDSSITTSRTTARWARVSFPSNPAYCMVCGDLHQMGDMVLDQTRLMHPTCSKCKERIDAEHTRPLRIYHGTSY